MIQKSVFLNRSLIKLLVALCILLVILFVTSTSHLVSKVTNISIKSWFNSNDSRNEIKTVQASFKPQESKYVLSFSLFGKNSWLRYGENVVNVAIEANASKYYHNWTVRLYHDNFPLELQMNLSKKHDNLFFRDVREMDLLNLSLINASVSTIVNINAMTWRFIPIGDRNVDVMCSRDLDSALFERDGIAVKHWLDSGKIMHTMRDNPQHGVHILGGLWCFKNSKDRKKGQTILKILLDKAQRRNSMKEAAKGDDQNVLARYMWPLVKNDVIQHDAYLCTNYPGSIPFPSKRVSGFFVGCVRPCGPKALVCPHACRPTQHKNWTYC